MTEKLSADALIELLRKMTHDVRSPLASVISTLDMMAEGVYEPLIPRQARANDRARRGSRRVLAILDDFIFFVKANAGQIPIAEKPFDPRAALAGWCSDIEPSCTEKGLALHVVTLDAVPATLEADESMIGRAILPILWNAAIYTASGAVWVESAWESDVWCITVRDSGHGIPVEHQPHLFEPFWRGDERPQVATAGVGLGLAVAQAAARLLKGRISLDKTGPTGSTFCLVFPLKADVTVT